MLSIGWGAPTENKAPRDTILLVEDDDAVRRSLQLLLQGKGYAIRSHASGWTLLADPQVPAAACLVADYRIDDVDGIVVLKRLRARGWDRPALLITAFATPDLCRRARAAGFSEVLEKPLPDHVLLSALARALGPPPPSAG